MGKNVSKRKDRGESRPKGEKIPGFVQGLEYHRPEPNLAGMVYRWRERRPRKLRRLLEREGVGTK